MTKGDQQLHLVFGLRFGAVAANSAGVSVPVMVGVGAGELFGGLHRPFLEAQRAVAVLVELEEGGAARYPSARRG